MFTRSIAEAPRRTRGGLTSHILLQSGDAGGSNLAVTWVDLQAGKAQQPHRHTPEQIYVITRGRGRMTVGEETQAIREGDLVYVPANAVHYAENTGEGVLTYISAATPAFDLEALYDQGDLREGK